MSEYKICLNISSTAKKFEIDRKTLREWIQNEKLIALADPSSFRLSGGGRKLICQEMEDALVSRIEQERMQKQRVTRKNIADWAIEFSEEFGITNFEASAGWLDKFLKRNLFTRRKVSNMVAFTDEEIVNRAVSFINHTSSIIRQHKISESNIYNFDETSIFIEDNAQETIEKVGAKRVAMHSGNLTKVRITGILTASADGKKKFPTIIVKSTEEKVFAENNVINITANKSWMNSKMFIKWIDYIFPALTTSPNQILLVFDSARSHISKEVKLYLAKRKILFCVIPGGLTSWLQPADLLWFKPIKTVIRQHVVDWINSESVSRTRGGRIKQPNAKLLSEWIKDAWGKLSSDIIIKSFQIGFLGGIFDLHIAKDTILGPIFLERYRNSESFIDVYSDTACDSGISEIDE